MKRLYFLIPVIFVAVLGFLFNIQKVNAAGSDLFISEYVEGTSNNKAIEIYNPILNPVNLADYKIQSYINGSVSASATATTSAVINPGSVFVICNALAATTILDVCNLKVSGVGTVMTFNGDDALTLTKLDGTLVDVIGQIGFDPGSEWGSGLTSTSDNTLRRKCNLSQGDPDGADIFDPAVEWDGYATDSFDNLGVHSVCSATSTPTAVPTVEPDESSTPEPTNSPTLNPTATPTFSPTPVPEVEPSGTPASTPAITPTPKPEVKGEHTKYIRNWFRKFIKKCDKYIHESLTKHHNKQYGQTWPDPFEFKHFQNNHRR